jgi:hypothetical protein
MPPHIQEGRRAWVEKEPKEAAEIVERVSEGQG